MPDPPSRLRLRDLVTLTVLAASAGLAAHPLLQTSTPTVLIDAGASSDLPLSSGATHAYALDLTADQFLWLTVLQQGIDVVVRIYDPAGARIVEIDGPTGKYGPEQVRLIAASSGRYRIDVVSAEKNVPDGRYRLSVRERRPATDRDRRRIEAQTAYLDAIQLRLRGQAASLRQAIEKYERAADGWRSVDEPLEEAVALNDEGYVFRLLSEYATAKEFYQRALDIRHAIADGPGEAQTLTNLGAISYVVGENQKTLDYYERALALRRAEGNFQEQALLLSNMGEVYALLSEHQKALEYFRQALPAERRVGDRLRESLTLSNIGLVYSATGQFREALNFFNDALQAARASGNRRAEGRILDNRGTAYRELGDLRQARASFEAALALRRSGGDRLGESQSLNALGVLLARSGDHTGSLTFYEQALTLQRAVGSRRDQAATQNNIGAALIERGDLDAALATLEGARRVHQDVQDRRGEAESFHLLAKAHRRQGNLAGALTAGEAALDLIEALRTTSVSQDMRASYFALTQDVYALVIDVLMDLDARDRSRGYASRAFHVSERARARSLLDGLTEARSGIRQGISADLRARERELQDRINVAAERLQQLLGGDHREEDALRASRDMDALLDDFRELETEIRANSPRYAELTRPRPLDVSAVQQQVLDADTVLLEYALGRDRSYLWAVTSSSIAGFPLAPREQIERAAQSVYAHLTARNLEDGPETAMQRKRRIASADAQLDRAARALSDLLLRAVADLLPGRRLVIVADGALQYVPFGALPEPVGSSAAFADPLIVSHEIVSSPSASAIALLRADEPRQGEAGKTKNVAVIADPVFSSDDPRLRRRAASRDSPASQGPAVEAMSDVARSGSDVGVNRFRRLRFSRDEADAIVSLAPADARFEAVDFLASRATALSGDLGHYRVVHFATHGLLNNTHPELSGLVLSLYDEQGRPQDGFLRLHDIYNLNLHADLVVLSACETALGRDMKGEGLMGLARGFMYAGAPRVVASLWKVEDRATATLMKRFYENLLLGGRSAAAALRAAQVDLWRDKRWSTPYYWAGFILEGEWR